MRTLLFVVLGLFARTVVGQNVTDLESALQRQYDLLRVEQRRLDSLQTEIEKTTRLIELEKAQQRVDQSLVNSLMAEGVVLSQKIRATQKQIALSQSERETLQQRLVTQYTFIIDSLKKSEPDVPKSQRAQVRQRIQEWVERRAWIAPSIRLLSFDPKMVQAISLGHDTTLRSYVEQAVREIEVQLKEVKAARADFESAIALRQKTLEFADEARGGNPGFLLQPNVSRPIGSGLTEPAYDRQFALNANAVFVTGLLNQLSTPVMRTAGSANSNVTMDEYVSLLRSAEKELQVYRKSLQAKLNP